MTIGRTQDRTFSPAPRLRTRSEQQYSDRALRTRRWSGRWASTTTPIAVTQPTGTSSQPSSCWTVF